MTGHVCGREVYLEGVPAGVEIVVPVDSGRFVAVTIPEARALDLLESLRALFRQNGRST